MKAITKVRKISANVAQIKKDIYKLERKLKKEI